MENYKLLIAKGVDYFAKYRNVINPNIQVTELEEGVDIHTVLDNNTFDKIIFILSKDNVDFKSGIDLIYSNVLYNDVLVIIDASNFTDEENLKFDSVIEYLSDYVDILISDDQSDIDNYFKKFYN